MAKFVWVRCLLPGAGLLAATPALAQDVVPPKVNAATPTGVNIADGYFQLSVTDLAIGTLKLERSTLPPAKLPVNDPFFGMGITHNFDIYVSPTLQKALPPPYVRGQEYHTIVHLGAAGASGVYSQTTLSSTPFGFNIEAGKGDLQLVSGTYVYTDSSGTIYTFNPSVPAGGGSGPNSQRIDNILYADGRRESFSYNASKQLKMVSDNAGYAIVFDYNADGDVSAACAFNLSQDYVTASSTCSGAARVVTYTYTAKLLTGVTDVTGQTTTYAHYGTTYGAPISCVTPPGYSACKVSFGYDGLRRAIQHTTADGSLWQLDYDVTCNPDPDIPQSDGTCIVEMDDPNGKATTFGFTHSSPTGVTDPNGRYTVYHYMGANLQFPAYDQTPNGPYLIEADMPEGNKYLAQYAGPYNSVSKETIVAKTSSGLPDLVKTYAYGACTTPQNCAKPSAITDPKGNQTDFTYTSFGAITSEMQPAPSAGAARPLKLYTYVQKSAYVKNSGGTLVSTGVPIWVPDTMTQCQTVAGSSTAACDTAAPRLQTTYQYAAGAVANNQLPRGTEVKDLATGNTRLTCFTYDDVGRKITETSPRGTAGAGLAVCP